MSNVCEVCGGTFTEFFTHEFCGLVQRPPDGETRTGPTLAERVRIVASDLSPAASVDEALDLADDLEAREAEHAGTVKRLEAELAAERRDRPASPAPGGVKVRALNWRNTPMGHASAKAIGGWYYAFRDGTWNLGNAEVERKAGPNLKAAKAAAQADFAARVRACLVSAPPVEPAPAEDVRAAALREAERIARKLAADADAAADRALHVDAIRSAHMRAEMAEGIADLIAALAQEKPHAD